MIHSLERVVYRAYDESGSLLYVGVTSRLKQRLDAHRWRTPWWPEVACVEIDPPADHTLAQLAEYVQIGRLAPRYNKAANRRRGWGYTRDGLRYMPERDEFRSAEDRVAA